MALIPWHGGPSIVNPANERGLGFSSTFGGSSAGTARWLDECHLRHQIDLAVGQALFDHSFAERLLADPTLAVDAELQVRTLAAGQIRANSLRANSLHDFARQMFDQFWAPYRPAILQQGRGDIIELN
jgi:hypothetical protein